MAKKKITVIIPIHTLEGGLNELYPKALASVPEEAELIVATSEAILTELKTMTEREAKFVTNDDTSFCTLVNKAVKEVKTEFFSILEADDLLTANWYKNADKYIQYKPDASAFLFLTDFVQPEGKDGDRPFVMFSNEAPLATGFSKETGVVDFDCLDHFVNYNVTGAVINKKDWDDVGGLKTNITLTFWYEWLFRMAYNQKKIVVIPKTGYKHTINRDGALYKSYEGNLPDREVEYWFKVAKTEYYYKKQRELPSIDELLKEEEDQSDKA